MNTVSKAAGLLSLAFALPSHAGLAGTEMSMRTLLQASAVSPAFVTAFERRTIVSDLLVEYPNVASLFNPGTAVPPGYAESLVNVAIDVSNTAITIDFANSAPATQFAAAHQNTYIFRFDSAALVDIRGAVINTAATNLGLEDTDLTFAGNELFINVQNLRFDANTFARIDLVVDGGPLPVPEPSTYLMLALGLAVVVARKAQVSSAGRARNP